MYLNNKKKVICVATSDGNYDAMTYTLSVNGLPTQNAPYTLMKFVEAEEN